MGCGASVMNRDGGDGNTASAPQPKKEAAEGESFGSDLKSFLIKIIKEPEYAKSLPDHLAATEDPTNQVEKMLKMLMSIVDMVKDTTTPKHDIPEFLVGCLVAFLYHLTMKPAAPEKQVELQSLQDTGYHVDAKWADAVYDKEEVEDPKAALVVSMAAEPTPKTLKVEDVAYFRAASKLGQPAVAVVADRERELILVIVRGTANMKDVLTDLAGAAREWEGGYAHESVSLGARKVFDEIKEYVLNLKAQNPSFAVRCVGHSLGGGTAGCLSILMHHDEEFAARIYGGVPMPGKKSKGSYMITAVGFGSAACINKELVEEAHPYCTTIVHDADLVPRLCTDNISDFIVLADNLVDTFKLVADDMRMLMKGTKPEGYDFRKVLGMLKKAASDPGGLLKDLLDEKMDKAEDAVDAAAASNEKRLYAPGRLMFLSKPEKGNGPYTISKGSMASETSKMLLKGSMFKDHSCGGYVKVCCLGRLPPPPAA
ncbi:hypothetical protein CHLRE_09g390615v5 [Chlamydomonas reinhardtii]|uniref:Fungal lipase-type domain-containing protein n=1 Tax=Chlamydomonas reinhardtii TaxID=3055 RepID=A0A2K3DE56_CHLRE|nr:uncharacterized protein CHLRE_09g390615v5 [Chlamydomonas reinhardtii]PNW78804.1 hypothetical protein CHLRE_09g390615v5 [Chlamydomonas reinhardtii]